MEHTELLDKLKVILRSAPSDVQEDEVQSVAQILKESKLTSLHLADSNIGCNGLKFLTQVLKHTQIHTLDLKQNNLRDESVRYLAESLKDTQIKHLDLSGNRVGIDTAKCLNEILSKTKLKSLDLDVHCREAPDDYNYISHELFRGRVHITLLNNKIGFKTAQYLNKMFPSISELTLGLIFEADDVQYLAQAFKGTKIGMLRLYCNHIMQDNGVEYAIGAFKDSQIFTLNLNGEKLPLEGVQRLAEFLRRVKVLDLRLCNNQMGDEGLKHLVPALKDSDIMYIHLPGNDIKAEGAQYLSGILRDSKIVYINLSHNTIGADGAKYLAEGLPDSQVTSLDLTGNGIGYVGYQYLGDVVDDTNISWVNLHRNNIEAGLAEGEKFDPNKIPRISKPVHRKICNMFELLVSLNPLTNKFEFIAPRNMKSFSIFEMELYAFFFRSLKDNPNCEVHIFDLMCKAENGFKLDIMNKINEFLETRQHKFNTFFDSKLPCLLESLGRVNGANIVRSFENLELSDIVQNLLLHRVFYYVDEKQEILHPYIYKLLDKYNMPLFSDRLEPNKRADIIAFFQEYPEMDCAQEIVDLLGSQSYL
ncbi:uncharacterized protein LOC123307492 [Coccinella septempunctata]|uniref:uncharacterized protein LOC123307492 n=1 Tax=Coccinella septempunctata TaxID=41139 RepID=UPI001D06535E|nr:uncharacterized protein LOC123307492 [Coccinella septempunctata]XP_044745759.1 uncharacterized protein LOC123307492 [Coccinella septempunctata]XP_044745760.1 uncharacterized protein LOC123307492 [Coccinella septempunctata]XP_044745761.1 uncharacterized protein LOC123307492 [Coccinella septempunctata]XP_044745762.1 uncharacterized protein LOC123307492 [Coccinella septempunctata]